MAIILSVKSCYYVFILIYEVQKIHKYVPSVDIDIMVGIHKG